MKLVYTAIANDLTQELAALAQSYADKGSRVFYIAPNSLSFEKERKVLKSLPQQASFAITVTRFAQMARYFVLNRAPHKETLDDTGLAMLFHKVLADENLELFVYKRLRKDANFIQELVDLYKEMKTANLMPSDLEAMKDVAKQADLQAIFRAADLLLRQGDYDNQSQLAYFSEEVAAGHLDEELSRTVLVIDGFTRFSAEEDRLVALLSSRCKELIIGAYLSPKAQRSSHTYGSIYQASREFLGQLARTYQVTPTYMGSQEQAASPFAQLAGLFESQHDFSYDGEQLTEEARDAIQISEYASQKDELTAVASQIRRLLAQGVRYKDILVLLGDVDAYRLQLSQAFSQQDIPYYLGKNESMAHHPLVNFVDALYRIKRSNFRTEDVVNLLKSGLYGQVSEEELDQFESYLNFAKIQGKKKFTSDFTINPKDRFDLEKLNSLRTKLLTPLDKLLKSSDQKGTSLLQKFTSFMEQVAVMDNLSGLAAASSQLEKDQHEQAWATFSQVLTTFSTIFGEEKISVLDCLSLLRTGMLTADYRTVPATVDVVNVKSYDLVEPHTADYVFALGMTQSHFPKISQNKSLLTDEERAAINEATEDFSRLEIASLENSKKNHFAALSLFTSAKKELHLSLPRLVNESEDQLSVYLRELVDLGVDMQQIQGHSTDLVGHYKSLLSTVIAVNRGDLERELTKEEETFWSVAVRYLRKRLEEDKIIIPAINQKEDLTTQTVAKEVLDLRFAPSQPISISSTALTTYYTNQYLYFVRYILGLEEQGTIQPDDRQHGLYLHKVFEVFMADHSDLTFDQKLTRAIHTAQAQPDLAIYYQEDQEGVLSQSILADVARATASLFDQEDEQVQVLDQERRFAFVLDDKVRISGMIDRVDQLTGEQELTGLVDYKSRDMTFKLDKFFYGLNSQLPTYLEALRQGQASPDRKPLSSQQLLGAMYLHMHNPQVKLADIKSADDLLTKPLGKLHYQGLFSTNATGKLSAAYKASNQFSPEELETLLDYNLQLYREAEAGIRSGHFAINPYTTDKKAVQGEQLKRITRFEADSHMSQARYLTPLPRAGKKLSQDEILQMMGGDQDA